MLSSEPVVTRTHFEESTGWVLKPEGACKGEVCVPLGESEAATSDRVDLRVVAEPLGMGLVHDEASDMWALGPETFGGRALATAKAPNLTLPDLDGKPFELASLLGSKVLLVAWSPY